MRFLVLIALLIAQADAQQWTQLQPGGDAPTPRGNAAAIYDPVGHRLVAFGGRVPGGELNDVWALDLREMRWHNITPNSGPAPTPRWSHNAVYDPTAQRMLVWSGRRGGMFYNDVWAFDLNAQTWTQLVASGPAPNLRYGTAAVFDPLANELVNFAGFTDAGRFDDTWRFDPENLRWRELGMTNNPGPRCLHSASYDSRRHRMLIYGGQRGSASLGDLWALDLNGDSWRELTPTTSPPGRTFAASIYDALSDRLVVFGGASGGEKSADVWAFALADSSWSAVATSGAAPAARSGAAAAYIESENRALYFGGEAAVGFFNEVWSLENLAARETAVQQMGWARIKVDAYP
jgi:hypothetical protein